MRKKIFYVLAVLISALFLSACQNDLSDDFLEEDLQKLSEGLFLRSAQNGEEAKVLFLTEEAAGTFNFPDDILFLIEDGDALVINQFLTVIDYHVFPEDKEAVFRVAEWGEKPVFMGNINGNDVYAPYGKSIYGVRLPFEKEDIGSQESEGINRFSGLLKAKSYVLAIKGEQIKIFNIDSKELISVIGKQVGNDLKFKIKAQDWTLTWLENSPIGSLFKLITPAGEITTYTLKR